MQVTLGPSISGFIFVSHNLNQFVGKNGKLSYTLSVKKELLYYNARFKSMQMITRKKM